MKTALSLNVQRLLDEQVSSGRYRSADEVVLRGLELLRHEEAESLDSPRGNNPFEAFALIAQEVPDADWEKVPSDLSKDPDRYLFGAKQNS
jgi:Arc/MetJ-type ribon-helix-helix transcriptional regulator